ncbi:MAG: hypothetical protein HYY21_08425 [Candidatus Tectomicrobia bacterium]|nr:hypothetical protein [Candidatus Tectomicrobia bacterium]
MRTPPDRTESPGKDLETRWEKVLRGEATPEEADSVRQEAARLGRKAQFEAQAEVSSLVNRLVAQHAASPELRQHFVDLLKEERKVREKQRFRATLVGAVAASLVIAAGWWSFGWLPGSKDPYRIIAKEARAAYHSAMLGQQPARTKNSRLDKVQAWFETTLHYQPEVFFRESAEFALEEAGIANIYGEKVPTILFRSDGKPVLLVVLPPKQDVAWAEIPENQWEIKTGEDSPPTSIWRRGKSVYALVGYAPPEKMKALSLAIAPARKNR